MWVRGLKLLRLYHGGHQLGSHPMWVRGLKRNTAYKCPSGIVAPYVGAWIETPLEESKNPYVRSHPMWVRGLKRRTLSRNNQADRSHPMWVRGLKLLCLLVVFLNRFVAPYVGAWIETWQCS